MTTDDDKIQAKIEAALYAAGRPLSIKELTSAAGIMSKRKTLSYIKSLARIVNSNLKAIEIVELLDHKFSLQLRGDYQKIARRFSTKPLLSNSALKTLSHLAYFQPMTGIELAKRRGRHVYQDIRNLETLGFIVGNKQGRTNVYRTTNTFSEYFGVSSDPDTMKKQLFQELQKTKPLKG